MERPDWAPQGIDLSVPSVARMYDYYLGGSHNFEADRVAARAAMEAFPGLPKIMQANRAFMRRAVRYAVDQGITQFLDIGSGIPTFGNVHEVARAAHPEVRVLYVDRDPVAVAHSRAVLDDDPRTRVLAADFRDPEAVLNSPEATELFDLDRPIALLLVALLHFVEDTDKPLETMATYRAAMAPGSLLILTHASTDTGPRTEKEGDAVSDVYRRGGNNLVMRNREEVTAFFEGMEMVEPGLVPMPEWRPEGPLDQEDPVVFTGFAGVGRTA
ncbi:SAM-dependent methyltransferase [Streptomyces alkaliphilus]|uniref:SAM-dependent methyltransferase n=1 Tax=Streptomyces alkaliphilus TaxID=1472722 RepID=UPI0011816002|nr:SAM-dependent methyltransferase [Streptomyces alkaliphilus]MQS08956.1 hypothetical protein [Streptomyces alkaliphilus]